VKNKHMAEQIRTVDMEELVRIRNSMEKDVAE
jgi:hypothetical protein